MSSDEGIAAGPCDFPYHGVEGVTSRNGKTVRQEPSEWPLVANHGPSHCPVEAYSSLTPYKRRLQAGHADGWGLGGPHTDDENQIPQIQNSGSNPLKGTVKLSGILGF